MNESRFQEHLSSDYAGSDTLSDPSYSPRKGASRDGADIITQIRAATSAPSPLTSYLKDPAIISALDGSDSSDRSRSHRLVLAEEEKQAHHLKSILRSTGDRLDREMRRADRALARAEQAEAHVLELTTRATAAESGKHYAELEATRARDDIKYRQLQIERLESENRRLQSQVSLLERQKNEAEDSAARARETARQLQLELRTLSAREAGSDETRHFGMRKWFNSGRMEGYDSGHAEGFESGREEGFDEGREYGFSEGEEAGFTEGRKTGRKEGYYEGWEQGRKAERDHALQAFDQFLTAEDLNSAHCDSYSYFCCQHWGPRNLPKLPLSAFSPPNTGTSDTFPFPPTSSAVVPTGIVDAHLRVSAIPDDVNRYKGDIGQLVLEKTEGVVLIVENQPSDDIASSVQGLPQRIDLPILSVSVPFSLDGTAPAEPPSYLAGTNPPTTLWTTYTSATPEAIANLSWALEHGRAVDIDIQSDIMASISIGGSSLYDTFEDLLTKATSPGLQATGNKRKPIVLSNIFPPPLSLDEPIVKTMKHPDYLQYQSRISSLSLFEDVHLKITPPMRGTSETGSPDDLKVWKGKLKLYIGPVLEAFGFERMIFGSSPSLAGEPFNLPVSWYDLVRESFAELGVEQDAIDNVFMNNAKRVYGGSS
ncbi:hypothetical protein EV401DRAFT_2088010 [Pisolithus croceorrhizus]|nr:hypothetical protein EV401DRAFT_2088010 [Pisolithus croceorrhizus]